jgi:hypothetical protein
MIEIFYLGIGLLIGIFIALGIDLFNAVRANEVYRRTVAHKNKTINDLLNQIDNLRGK